MKRITKPNKVLNPAYRKINITRSQINAFKTLLSECLEHIKINEEKKESEENVKKYIGEFLQKSFYQDHLINTKSRIDLAIYSGKDANSPISVLIEAKRPSNANEFLTPENINKKALQELLLYYLKERVTVGNNQIKHLIATNGYEWYFFKGEDFYNLFYKNKRLVKEYNDFINGQKDTTKNELFYNEIAPKYIDEAQNELPFLHINIKDFESLLSIDNVDDDKLVALYKVFSPIHLLGQSYGNDSNQLNKQFYYELLHIIGLEEVKDGGKKLILRKTSTTRNYGSLLESTIFTLDDRDYLRKVDNLRSFGATREEQLYNVALELCLTWINRVLFLKLLESQLLAYHDGNPKYKFLNSDFIQGFDDLEELFFSALAKKPEDRNERLKAKYQLIPYLNSSLFEPNELEDKALQISNLKDADLELYDKTILKDSQIKRLTGKLNTLDYLFRFLDAYDFSSEDGEKIDETNQAKTLISASVLGLIFEKINGYKDGSFYTPAYITMYMSSEALRRAVLQKFNTHYQWDCKNFEDLKEDLKDLIRTGNREAIRQQANTLINSLKICDPAVGSGHFLVSCLNELIAIKSELGLLIDKDGKRLNIYIQLDNDELIIEDENEDLFVYKPNNPASQRIQETLFHEKQSLIENCLFGVDINPNSVKICRLRLWIELLKNAYYTLHPLGEDGRGLQTLPNIDINIKTGNSLISRFGLDDDLKTAFKSGDNPYTLQDYKNAVKEYKGSNDKTRKRDIIAIINTIKSAFKSSLDTKFKKRIADARGKYEQKQITLQNLEAFGEKPSKKELDELKKLALDFERAETEKEEMLNNAIYQNAFEWRFEFPEVLDENADFIGFDVVIGNPPYIRQEEISWMKDYLKDRFLTYSGTADIYVFFVEKAFSIMKQGGEFSYIMPNKWMQTGYGKPLRTFLLTQCLHNIIDFGDLQVFEEATTYPCILEGSKAATKHSFYSTLVQTLAFDAGFGKYAHTRKVSIATDEIDEETWVITSKEDQDILRKLKVNCISLAEYVGGEAHYGIKTGLTEAFVINTETKNRIIKEDPKSAQLIKPFMLGRDISTYSTAENSSWLILVPKGFTIRRNLPTDSPYYLSEPPPRYGNMPLDDAWDWFSNNHEGIAKHLLPHKTKAEKRTDKGDFWWELRACDYYNEFEKPKIMYQKFQVKPCFIYDENGLYCNDSMWIISKDDKTLVAILNSKMGWWLISKYCTAIQNGYQLIWNYFGKIAIPNFTPAQSAPIIELVDKILAAKKSNPEADTTVWEREIDAMVYKLYGLTYEEVKVVDKDFWVVYKSR